MANETRSPPPRLKNRYRLLKWLGQGGMGTVYQARDETLDRDVAIKFLSPRQITDQESSARFMREARTVARLSHPNIMTLYDVDREGEWHYLVLEYIPGQDLHTLTAELAGLLPIQDSLQTIHGALAALAYAHDQGVVHRDIKPENVMITPDGQVKVTDFGLSLAQGDVRLTQEDTIVGSILYLAPEVLDGGAADVRADLYAVGAIFYELLTGRPPFIGENFVTIVSQLLTKPITPPQTLNASVPKGVAQIVLKLLAKKPDERYASAAEVLALLPDPDYWLHLELPGSLTLKDLDYFLRGIWLECCGHLSAFNIYGQTYTQIFDDGFFDDEKDMNVKFSRIFNPGLEAEYEYDFGSTTHLTLRVVGERTGKVSKKEIQVMARNDPPAISCYVCGKPATDVCSICVYEAKGWLCEEHIESHECGDEYFLPVVNSPRVGVCAYAGDA